MSGALTTFIAFLIATAFVVGFLLGRMLVQEMLVQESLQRQVEALKASMSKKEGNQK